MDFIDISFLKEETKEKYKELINENCKKIYS